MTLVLTDTVIVMPAFNEEESVGDVVREVRRELDGALCVVVDDGSNDGTAAAAAAAGATVISLPFNLGVGGAMRTGFLYAQRNGYRNVVQIDADGQHDPADVRAMLKALESADLVIGARFAGSGEYAVKGPRRWAMVILARILSLVTGTKLTDSTSGLRASGPRAVALFATHYPAEYLGDTIESLVIAAREGLTVRQVPAAMRPRAGGNPSHNPVEAAVYLFRALVALCFALITPRQLKRNLGASPR